MINLAVVGVGFMGEKHVKTFCMFDQIRLKAVCDVSTERVKQIGSVYGATPYTDYREMLQNEELDAISIAVPTRLHAKIVIAASNYVKNILVEKPLASSLREAEEMLFITKKENVKLMVGQIERFNPAVEALKNLMSIENLSLPIMCHARRMGPYSPRIRDQGAILGLAIHDIDVFRYLLARKVKRVYSKGFSVVSEFEDYASLILEFDDGVLCTIEASQITPHRERILGLNFMREYVHVDLLEQGVWMYRADETGSAGKKVHVEEIMKQDSLRLELQHFVDVVSKGAQIRVDGEEGLSDLRVSLAALDSMKIGTPVIINC
jgi:UDP-N-acetylglucosamine 3-dehydrogenase